MLQAFIKEIKKVDNDLLIKHKLLWMKGPDFDNLEEYKMLDDYKMWEAMKIIAYEDEFTGFEKALALDFLYNNRWDIEKNDTKTNVTNKGFIGDVYYTKVKPSKFYDQEPDNQILVQLSKKEPPKLLSEIGRFISINKKREVEEKYIIRRPQEN
jgi:hypothetical protein